MQETFFRINHSRTRAHVEILVEDAKAFIEDAKVLADENPDEAKELMEAAEEYLDDALDLIEGITETESNARAT